MYRKEILYIAFQDRGGNAALEKIQGLYTTEHEQTFKKWGAVAVNKYKYYIDNFLLQGFIAKLCKDNRMFDAMPELKAMVGDSSTWDRVKNNVAGMLCGKISLEDMGKFERKVSFMDSVLGNVNTFVCGRKENGGGKQNLLVEGVDYKLPKYLSIPKTPQYICTMYGECKAQVEEDLKQMEDVLEESELCAVRERYALELQKTKQSEDEFKKKIMEDIMSDVMGDVMSKEEGEGNNANNNAVKSVQIDDDFTKQLKILMTKLIFLTDDKKNETRVELALANNIMSWLESIQHIADAISKMEEDGKKAHGNLKVSRRCRLQNENPKLIGDEMLVTCPTQPNTFRMKINGVFAEHENHIDQILEKVLTEDPDFKDWYRMEFIWRVHEKTMTDSEKEALFVSEKFKEWQKKSYSGNDTDADEEEMKAEMIVAYFSWEWLEDLDIAVKKVLEKEQESGRSGVSYYTLKWMKEPICCLLWDKTTGENIHLDKGWKYDEGVSIYDGLSLSEQVLLQQQHLTMIERYEQEHERLDEMLKKRDDRRKMDVMLDKCRREQLKNKKFTNVVLEKYEKCLSELSVEMMMREETGQNNWKERKMEAKAGANKAGASMGALSKDAKEFVPLNHSTLTSPTSLIKHVASHAAAKN